MGTEPGERVVIPAESLFQPLGDEAVVLSIITEMYYGLNDTAKRVWELLIATGDKEKVIAEMLKEFDVDEKVLRGDVDRLLQELQQAQLIRIEE